MMHGQQNVKLKIVFCSFSGRIWNKHIKLLYLKYVYIKTPISMCLLNCARLHIYYWYIFNVIV